MTNYRTPIIVIDDIREEGLQIANAIMDSGHSARFIQYDPVKIQEQKKAPLFGVRFVFMDIELVGGGTFGDGSSQFSAVERTILDLLSEFNGPYIMILWSKHTDHCDRLKAHLLERLPNHHHPIEFKSLSKDEYKDGANMANLLAEVTRHIESLGAIDCLLAWENNIHSASSSTLAALIEIAHEWQGDSLNLKIRDVLGKLARAEGEKNLSETNAVFHLYSALKNILHDKLTSYNYAGRPQLGDWGKVIMEGSTSTQQPQCASILHSMMHLDLSEDDSADAQEPGDVFAYPSIEDLPIPKLTAANIDDLFANIDKKIQLPTGTGATDVEKKTYRDLVKSKSSFVLMEISPPCDHAQNKAPWHKYIVGLRIPVDKIDSIGEYTKLIPAVQLPGDTSPFVIVFNARCTLSLPKSMASKLGKRMFRIRQDLCSAIMVWLAQQNSRLGHVSLS